MDNGKLIMWGWVLTFSIFNSQFSIALADCLLLPIIGNGSDGSPYRPAIPPGIEGAVGANWSAQIPSNPNGSPQFPDTYVCFPTSFRLPPGIASKAIPPADAAAAILTRDSKADLKAMTPPAAVIKGSWQDYRNRTIRLAKIKFGVALAWAASATDNFNTGTSALSGNWSVGYATEGTPTVVSNAAQCATGVRCVASYNALTPGAAQYAQGVIVQYQSGVGDGDAGPAVRMPAPTSFDGYFARCGNFSTATVSTILQKRVAGASSTVATETAASAWAFGDISRLEITGTGLTLKRNGVSVLTGTDSTLTSGRGGMMLNSLNATVSGDTARLDDFEVGDLAGGAAPTRRRVVGIQ